MKHAVSYLRYIVFIIIPFLFNADALLDWPHWHGPDGTNISKETGWDPQAITKDSNIVWKAQVGQGFSSFSIQGNYIYTMGWAKNTDTVYCLDFATGKPVWTYSYACGTADYNGARSTPTADGDNLYTFSQQGHLFCFNSQTGKVKWQVNCVSQYKAVPPSWGMPCSPVSRATS